MATFSGSAMILLNLRSGFHIRGFEIDPNGIAIVSQRKRLTGGDG